MIDVVRDQLYGTDYLKEEDPSLFVSRKTARGPLTDTWIQDYWRECKVGPRGTGRGLAPVFPPIFSLNSSPR